MSRHVPSSFYGPSPIPKYPFLAAIVRESQVWWATGQLRKSEQQQVACTGFVVVSDSTEGAQLRPVERCVAQAGGKTCYGITSVTR
jgi:hypothetical protein